MYRHFCYILVVTETNGDQPWFPVGANYTEVWLWGDGVHLTDWSPGWRGLMGTRDWSLIGPDEVALKYDWSGSSSLWIFSNKLHLYSDRVGLEFVTILTIPCWSVLLITSNQPHRESQGCFVHIFAHSSIPFFKRTLPPSNDSEM